jgi:hypothetical protein
LVAITALASGVFAGTGWAFPPSGAEFDLDATPEFVDAYANISTQAKGAEAVCPNPDDQQLAFFGLMLGLEASYPQVNFPSVLHLQNLWIAGFTEVPDLATELTNLVYVSDPEDPDNPVRTGSWSAETGEGSVPAPGPQHEPDAWFHVIATCNDFKPLEEIDPAAVNFALGALNDEFCGGVYFCPVPFEDTYPAYIAEAARRLKPVLIGDSVAYGIDEVCVDCEDNAETRSKRPSPASVVVLTPTFTG